MAGPQHVVTAGDIARMIQLIRAESMELVETAPEHLRSEFGFGMVHGFLKAANRFGTLFEEHLAELERKEEQFEREFGNDGEAAPSPRSRPANGRPDPDTTW